MLIEWLLVISIYPNSPEFVGIDRYRTRTECEAKGQIIKERAHQQNVDFLYVCTKNREESSNVSYRK